MFTKKKSILIGAVSTACALFSSTAIANDTAKRIAALEKELQALKAQVKTQIEQEQQDKANSVKFGGALRFNYGYLEYDDAQSDRGGDIVEGSPTSVKRQKDSWTFARIMGSADPNWLLVATDG